MTIEKPESYINEEEKKIDKVSENIEKEKEAKDFLSKYYSSDTIHEKFKTFLIQNNGYEEYNAIQKSNEIIQDIKDFIPTLQINFYDEDEGSGIGGISLGGIIMMVGNEPVSAVVHEIHHEIRRHGEILAKNPKRKDFDIIAQINNTIIDKNKAKIDEQINGITSIRDLFKEYMKIADSKDKDGIISEDLKKGAKTFLESKIGLTVNEKLRSLIEKILGNLEKSDFIGEIQFDIWSYFQRLNEIIGKIDYVKNPKEIGAFSILNKYDHWVSLGKPEDMKSIFDTDFENIFDGENIIFNQYFDKKLLNQLKKEIVNNNSGKPNLSYT